jgi:hypothetical protein
MKNKKYLATLLLFLSLFLPIDLFGARLFKDYSEGDIVSYSFKNVALNFNFLPSNHTWYYYSKLEFQVDQKIEKIASSSFFLDVTIKWVDSFPQMTSPHSFQLKIEIDKEGNKKSFRSFGYWGVSESFFNFLSVGCENWLLPSPKNFSKKRFQEIIPSELGQMNLVSSFLFFSENNKEDLLTMFYDTESIFNTKGFANICYSKIDGVCKYRNIFNVIYSPKLEVNKLIDFTFLKNISLGFQMINSQLK